MKTILSICYLFLTFLAIAQVDISGMVITSKNIPVAGANVFIKGTYDGTTTDSLGNFRFRTSETGNQIIIASFVGYETQSLNITITGEITNLQFAMKEETSELDEVVINAGTFEASDKKKSVILKPIDIALTAGANGDIFGALGTLPGSQKVGEEGRLFVRGGESYETKTFMDGMLINTPYYSKMPDLPTRGRFSPLLFNGSVFSTGGYSAEYGQALSSIVALNTTALEPESKSSISIMTVGVQGAFAKRWESTSLAMTGELLHTGLSNKVFKQNIHWINEPVITGSTLMFRQKTSETGMIKTFGSFSYDASSLVYNNYHESLFQNIALKNSNSYLNTTYNEELNKNWILNSGIAFNLDFINTGLDENTILTSKNTTQLKATFTNLSFKNVTAKMGFDYLFYNYKQDIKMAGNYIMDFSNNQGSTFFETETKISKYVALRSGLRAEYNSLQNKMNVNLRMSAAVKTGKSS